jgi:hypothetical protein
MQIMILNRIEKNSNRNLKISKFGYVICVNIIYTYQIKYIIILGKCDDNKMMVDNKINFFIFVFFNISNSDGSDDPFGTFLTGLIIGAIVGIVLGFAGHRIYIFVVFL